jgi:F-type H+-transporting ATPase subunit b
MNHIMMMAIVSTLNFAILLFAILKFAKPALDKGIASKQQSIVQSIEETEKNLADITAELDDYKRKLQVMEQEIASIRTDAEQRGKAAAKSIQENTHQEIEALGRRVDRQIEQEMANLRNSLRREFSNRVILAAEEMAQGHLNKLSHTALVEHFAYALKESHS